MLKVVKDSETTYNVMNEETGKLVLKNSLPSAMFHVQVEVMNYDTLQQMIIVSSDMVDKMFFYDEKGEMVIGFVGSKVAFEKHNNHGQMMHKDIFGEQKPIEEKVLGDGEDGIKVDIRFVSPTHYSFFADPRWIKAEFDNQNKNEVEMEFYEDQKHNALPNYYRFDMQHRLIMTLHAQSMEEGEAVYKENYEQSEFPSFLS